MDTWRLSTRSSFIRRIKNIDRFRSNANGFERFAVSRNEPIWRISPGYNFHEQASLMLVFGAVNSDHKSTPDNGKPLSKETVSKASSELNNLLQIISGTSAEI